MNIIDILIAIIYGIVEGISEWLPISSTGHLIILNEYLSFSEMSDEFWNLFLVVIQLGAILAVVFSFFHRLNPFGKNKEKTEKKNILRNWLLIIVGCLPAAIFGLLFDNFLDQYLYNNITVSITLIVYGIAFILIEKYNNKNPNINDINEFTWKTALIIGMAQVLALIPGTSRSGITIIAALLIGCNRISATEYSFLLSIPVMVGASLLKIVKFIILDVEVTLNEIMILLTGCVVAFAVSLFIVNFLLKFIKKHDFTFFGWYRIILGIVLILIFLI